MMIVIPSSSLRQLEHFQHIFSRMGIQISRRLISKQQRRIVDQRARAIATRCCCPPDSCEGS